MPPLDSCQVRSQMEDLHTSCTCAEPSINARRTKRKQGMARWMRLEESCWPHNKQWHSVQHLVSEESDSKETWQHPKSKQWHHIDYAIVRQSHHRKCVDAFVKHEADLVWHWPPDAMDEAGSRGEEGVSQATWWSRHTGIWRIQTAWQEQEYRWQRGDDNQVRFF